MPSTPLICSSIGVDTVSAITLGLAPGYCARTTTVGGATSGYSEIGNAGSDRSPATKITVDSTPAKIGRSMKNLEKFMTVSLISGLRSTRVPARPTVAERTDSLLLFLIFAGALLRAPG